MMVYVYVYIVDISYAGLQGIEIERQTVMEMVLSLCVYSHPKEISLPQG